MTHAKIVSIALAEVGNPVYLSKCDFVQYGCTSQLCWTANQYRRQQNCECGRMSQDCSLCVKTQTQQTDFIDHWTHLQATCLIKDELEICLLLFQLLV
jgi:hypothetical protein